MQSIWILSSSKFDLHYCNNIFVPFYSEKKKRNTDFLLIHKIHKIP